MRAFDAGDSGRANQHTATGHKLFSAVLALLVVEACGVVYGDIGTSVLYTLREIFFGAHTFGQVPITWGNVLGAVSLIFWS
ncbi:MAG TPA: KUP/HAK/KT family potassium transporter, partial [Candidatus Tectomicrobia bacterium]